MMHRAAGPGWSITVDTSPPMLMALYLRDVAGLTDAGTPALSPAHPPVHSCDPRQLTAQVGGPAALRTEWEAWWHDLVLGHNGIGADLDPPDDDAFRGSPALQKLMQAHFGAALAWTRERTAEYVAQSEQTAGRHELLGQLVAARELELARDAREFALTVIELPLCEPRAWFVEPDRLIMSQQLAQDEDAYLSYLQPIVELLV